MDINKAVKAAISTDSYIYRKSTMYPCQGTRSAIRPTNSYETCMIVTFENEKPQRYSRNWNPTADDLMADDWELLKV